MQTIALILIVACAGTNTLRFACQAAAPLAGVPAPVPSVPAPSAPLPNAPAPGVPVSAPGIPTPNALAPSVPVPSPSVPVPAPGLPVPAPTLPVACKRAGATCTAEQKAQCAVLIVANDSLNAMEHEPMHVRICLLADYMLIVVA
ncbi:uncharacterized protein LOC129592918 [Paramacrobiotus metropolitanus]|uniref:uncharacterized protein LOC129592918 n=1 Tax=Paramacrobiotus metropolitanus TaxID=2943436 RepID=UPI00244562CF|nr:uncharacterized protein LOC129592918 [Paramacrobiotus metropolitanus]